MKIAYAGFAGAYSDMACREKFPDAETVPCKTFYEAFDAARKGNADCAMIPIDNTLAGRVADVHHLLPDSGLSMVGEHFLPVRHCLLGVKGSNINDVTHAHSHVHALPQCRKFIRENELIEVVGVDTAGAAADIAEKGDKTQAAIASRLAAEIYGLDILAADIQDDNTNTTRFVVLSPRPDDFEQGDDCITSLVFNTRHIPAALYKAIGGFATNGVNMLKLESYVDSNFNAAQFYCEVDGKPQDKNLSLALEELAFYGKDVKIMGTFKKADFRKSLRPQ